MKSVARAHRAKAATAAAQTSERREAGASQPTPVRALPETEPAQAPAKRSKTDPLSDLVTGTGLCEPVTSRRLAKQIRRTVKEWEARHGETLQAPWAGKPIWDTFPMPDPDLVPGLTPEGQALGEALMNRLCANSAARRGKPPESRPARPAKRSA